MKSINIILFDNYTSLDALGPAEVLCRLGNEYELNYYSIDGGIVNSSINSQIETLPISSMGKSHILLIPGGMGTRKLVKDELFIKLLTKYSNESEYVLAVCTGSALLAKTGLLNNRNATSNKISWDWVVSQNDKVHWVKTARWVIDGKYYTSSGVSAGIDMALGFVSDTINNEKANQISIGLEYVWNRNRDLDPFNH